MKAIYTIGALSILFILSCNNSSKSKNHSGNYVSEGYEKRAEGYDWKSVSITNTGADEISIAVRSRSDIKKPTCTFDSKAKKQKDNTYFTIIEGKKVLFIFDKNSLYIKTEYPDDRGILAFYCSGGGNIIDEYRKIEFPLDKQ